MDNSLSSQFPYCIGQFQSDDSISVIPTKWLTTDSKEHFCWWPGEYFKRYIKLNSPPKENWTLLGVKIVHYSRNLDSANRSLKFFELNTDIELYSEDDDDDEASQSLLAPPAKKMAQEPSQVCSLTFGSGLNADENLISYEVDKKCCCEENRELLIELRNTIYQMRDDLADMRQGNRNPAPIAKVDNLPKTTVEEVVAFDEELENSDFFSKMAKYLGQHGGRDVNECTRRILPQLMTNESAKGFNWVGGFGKIGLKTLPRILQLIAVAVRFTDKNAKQADVEAVVRRWFRTAADRGGGRSKRKTAES